MSAIYKNQEIIKSKDGYRVRGGNMVYESLTAATEAIDKRHPQPKRRANIAK